MREDQTQLITARLEHLQFMMDSGRMPLFRHRSDMFLFALEAYNIARGLSSRYYRLRDDLDIRFFVRFRFDYWLSEIQKWIEQLNGSDYRVDDDDFFAEGRAKRLTIGSTGSSTTISTACRAIVPRDPCRCPMRRFSNPSGPL